MSPDIDRDEQRFAQLLRESTPQPPFDISLEAVVRQRDRRRIAARTTIAVTAAAALLAAFAGLPALLQRGTLIRVAEATDNLSVEYHGATFNAPAGWRLDEEPACGLPANQSVILGTRSWPTAACPVPAPKQAPTWVWFTKIPTGIDMSGLDTTYAGKPSPRKIDIDGQPAYLQQQTRGNLGYVVTLPWLGVRAEISSPSDKTARQLLGRISAAATEKSLAVPEDADTVVLQSFDDGGRAKAARQVTVTGRKAAAILEELRGLKIRQESDSHCTPAADPGRVQLTAYGPSLEHRTYTVRGGNCTETYADTGVAGATTSTLRALIAQQLK
ncbi:hypothetical protein [Flindersiella endophytica]